MLTPTNVLLNLMASNLNFNLALGLSTLAIKTLEFSFKRPNSEPVLGQYAVIISLPILTSVKKRL